MASGMAKTMVNILFLTAHYHILASCFDKEHKSSSFMKQKVRAPPWTYPPKTCMPGNPQPPFSPFPLARLFFHVWLHAEGASVVKNIAYCFQKTSDIQQFPELWTTILKNKFFDQLLTFLYPGLCMENDLILENTKQDDPLMQLILKCFNA